MSTIDISAGTIHYEATGPADGRPVVFGARLPDGRPTLASGRRPARRPRAALHRPDLADGRAPGAVAPRRRPDHHRGGRHGRRAALRAGPRGRGAGRQRHRRGGQPAGGRAPPRAAGRAGAHELRCVRTLSTPGPAAGDPGRQVQGDVPRGGPGHARTRGAQARVRRPGAQQYRRAHRALGAPGALAPRGRRGPAPVHPVAAHRGDHGGGDAAVRLRQAHADRMVGRRRVLRAGGRRAAGRDDPERPPRGHRGGADLLDGRSARPARRSVVDGRGAHLRHCGSRA
ncbi:hydrolase, alpha/beta hydrolase family protein [Mycobacterium avium subsp. paratuberculosis S5]|nr:hydrolase, alpha/beta hydrolase family protein [Mycobacterium avium subsp. paratuberculosis S5]